MTVRAPSSSPAAEAAAGLVVVLVGNYPRDAQESMQRFAAALLDGLRSSGVSAELIVPPVRLGRFGASSLSGIGKWLAYLDKFVLFPVMLRRRLRNPAAKLVVHVCDHGNAMYGSAARGLPLVITCHDLLAVRGALGEETDCPATTTGKWLQRWILRSLSRASIVACVSSATKVDAGRLLGSSTRTCLIPIGLNHPYRPISAPEAAARLSRVAGLGERFILHVGSNLRRKNREGVLRIFARTASRWDGQLVIAGQLLSPELRSLSASLGISDRLVEVAKPDNDTLEALYNRATALLFPSRFEGFGWPIIEAQACGCPVICSQAEPMSEVAGEGALLRPVEDEDGFAADVLRLTEPAEREHWRQKGLLNAARFTTERMVLEYRRIYGEAVAAQ